MRKSHEFAQTLPRLEKRWNQSINTHLQILKCASQNVQEQNSGKFCPCKNNSVAHKSNRNDYKDEYRRTDQKRKQLLKT
ncbi:hypothetical protein GCM10007876_06960 [Litoribrevibacter albus]|uniref:Uncharacterized protein n=1 Tax=Litoribrevibacter albus TaxID=1473156 RepID=A0AA37S845_9GAMM|nr:hypothetical protein GCM10007876_06960 [Litoribrevibacter albus]